MSFKSILQDMRGEFGSISRKGFDVRFGYGMRSRSHRVVQDISLVVEALKQSCWANLPPELLRDVLMRIEGSESTWPPRKNVVACAGVCRSWREIMKEIVKTPEISAKLTFPISLKQPGPRGSLLQCYIKRNRGSQTYYLYLGLNQASNDDGKFLLAARKCRRPTCTDYIISLNGDDLSKGSSTYIGKLRSNFLGTKFTIYDGQSPNAGATRVTKCRSTRLVKVSPRVPVGNYPVAHISYELNVLGSRGPRRMQCVMDAIPASSIEPGGVAPTQTEFVHSSLDTFPSIPFFRSKSTRTEIFQSGPLSGQKDGMLGLRNKAPRWHEQLQCWCLNFNGRVTVASVKNFQLVASLENGALTPRLLVNDLQAALHLYTNFFPEFPGAIKLG
ncbi:hypothetical protein LWI29_000623 [Acer saccharum]|uniref:Tubby C-terminal domain-containing protein n=1 Tax=Acer saccharum TaxID=4024 RepID=A0AA39RWS3_ACESA|nr:hypothetical protein LWI29_000623 [Acer saccharum]KAK1560436.1 hypothetical protein Q3G72_026655 [Acer saccharum]